MNNNGLGRVGEAEQALVNQAAARLGPSGFDPSREWRAGFVAARDLASSLADQLGGDRVHPRLYDDSRDREGRTGALINAQHVRAQTIATAIRKMEPTK